MNFKQFLENDIYQDVFPFMKKEPTVNIDKNKYPTPEAYIKSKSRIGKKTEIAAEKISSARISSWFTGEEEILEIVNNATSIPPTPNTPKFNIAFVHTKSKEPLPNGKSRFRFLAFWEGNNKRLNKTDLEYLDPIGGIVYIGGYITDVWVNKAFRGTDKQGFSLYRELRKAAARRGVLTLAPGDDLTSKSYRAAQAKYDYKRS